MFALIDWALPPLTVFTEVTLIILSRKIRREARKEFGLLTSPVSGFLAGLLCRSIQGPEFMDQSRFRVANFKSQGYRILTVPGLEPNHVLGPPPRDR